MMVPMASIGLFTGMNNMVRGYAPVPPGPGLVFIGGSSNPQGVGVAANMTDVPGIADAFPAVQLSRTGALLGPNPTFLSEPKQDLQPRTTNLGGSYPVGTCGGELQQGRDLNASNPGLWGIATLTCDGSRLAPEFEWLNDNWPSTPPSGFNRTISSMASAETDHAKQLKVYQWDHGNDANVAQAVNYYNNLVTWAHRIRLVKGDIGIVLPILSNKNTAGSVQTVIAAMEAFAMRPDSSRVRTVYVHDIPLRDGAHYVDDSGGQKGYCEVGKRLAAATISAANQTLSNTSPRWGCQAEIVSATSLALPAIPLPPFWGGVNNKPDVALIVYSGASVNDVPAPAGWPQVTNGKQWAGLAADSRLHVWMRTLTASETAPNVSDVASDDAKIAGMCLIRDTLGMDATPTGSTVPASAPSTTVTWPSINTVSPNCLIVQVLAYRIDSTGTKVSGYTNPALVELTERTDIDSNVGSGYGFAIVTGIMVTPGPIGNTTATLANASSQALLTFAFKL